MSLCAALSRGSSPSILDKDEQFPGDVSQVLMCYSPRVSLQPPTLNMIEWPHDAPGVALSSRSRDPMPRTTRCGASVSAGMAITLMETYLTGRKGDVSKLKKSYPQREKLK